MKVLDYLKPTLTSKQLWTLGFIGITPLMILAPALISTEVAVQTTKLPLSQLAELILPFTVISFLYTGMVSSFLNKKQTSFFSLIWLMVSFTVLGLLAIGQGIHFSAQTLNHFVVTNEIFGELRDVAYLFNEKLTHLIWLPPVITFPVIIAGWELSESKLKHVSTKLNIFFGTIAGGWYGVITALAILEAQLAKYSFAWLVGLLLTSVVIGVVKKKLFSLGFIISVIANLAILSILVLWRVKFGGFPEPLNVLF